MQIQESQLKDFILDSGLVSRKEMEEAEAVASAKKTGIGKVLVLEGKLSEDDLRRTQAYILGIPFVDLKNQKIEQNVLSLIPESVARSHNIVAFRRSEAGLEVAMLDTEDLGAIDFIRKKVNLKILPRLTDNDSMRNVLIQYQKSLKAEFGDIIEKESASIKTLSEEEAPSSAGELKRLAEDLPVVRIVDTLLKHAILEDASDIHIEPMEDQLLVRYRIDGILRDAMVLPKSAGSGVVARVKVIANLKLDEKRLPQDGRFKIEIDGGQRVSFRVSTLPTYFGEKTVMRLLKESGAGFTLEGLGFHGDSLEKIHKAARYKTGMILATGPTGSGKTTTLYTILDILNTPAVNISTIEDPIEYQIPRVNQTQVKPEIGLTFANGLRSLVRQDPDIIMVGEIRDGETMSLAINAALTGHLVLSTLHTNSASGAIPRLVDMKAEPFLLISTVNVITAQRLVRKLGEDREKYFLDASALASLGESVDLDKVLSLLKEEKIVSPEASWDKIPFFRPMEGHEEDGYGGRIGIHEVMEISPAIEHLILKGAAEGEILVQARKEGMMTMMEDGIFKAVQGITTIEEVLRVISE